MPKANKLITNTVAQPIIMTGFRPYLSEIAPHKEDVRALPSMYADPSYNVELVVESNSEC